MWKKNMFNKFYFFWFLMLSLTANAEEIFSKKGWDELYSRRSFKLGITLEEFRKMPFPKEPNYFSSKYFKKAYLVCSNELSKKNTWLHPSAIRLDRDEKKIGIVKCHHYIKEKSNNKVHPARIILADWGMSTTFLFLKPKGQNKYFLYEIRSSSNRALFRQVLPLYNMALKKKPTFLLPNRIAVWANNINSISLMNMPDLNTIMILHELKIIKDIYNQRKKMIMIEKSKKL